MIRGVRPLPIDPLLADIVASLARGSRVVVRAPPGAGKTTRVPGALLDAGLAGSRQVLVLEPRRIAARAAAEFVATERGGAVGDEVGYRVRFEQRGGPRTRLWFLTEGVLGRQLISDPFLEAAGVVVLDEFHERHLQGDVALAVLCELQATVRSDLKLVVMSATLQTERLARYLGDCPVLTSEGRAHPVRIAYAAAPDDDPLPRRVARAVQEALTAADDDGGDVLVFLPGAAEIRRAADALESLAASDAFTIVPLHGDLPLDRQRQALQRGIRRKIVLSTNVAETALTIEGVTTVIDTGLARESRLDRRHGINVLRTVAISRASADQRAGRAGRDAPGRCWRLWTSAEHSARREHETAEVLRLDLSGTVLELHAWGLRDVRSFRWLDAPSEAALEQAESLLRLLGALDAQTGALTAIGRRMLVHTVPPRLARLLIEAEERGCGAAGATLAALASERDICAAQRAFGSGPTSWPSGLSDLLLRVHLFEEAERHGLARDACERLALDPAAVRAVARTRRHLRRAAIPTGAAAAESESLLRCCLAAFPDRVVRRRAAGAGRGVMVGGTGVVLADSSVVRDAELFVAVDIERGAARRGAEALVRIASAVQHEWLREMFPTAMHVVTELVFDAGSERVVERTRELFHDLALAETVRTKVADTVGAGELLALAARGDPWHAAGLGDAARAFLERLRFLQRWMPELELPGDMDVLLADTVAGLCRGRRSFAELRQADVLAAVRRQLTGVQARALDRDAPATFCLPSGRSVGVVYAGDKPPAVAARIQELFGLTATPRLAAGRVPLVVQLLAPNQRPVQITDDLASFWRRTYPEVRKQLRGRYPKHAWPEDPFSAEPTSRLRRPPR